MPLVMVMKRSSQTTLEQAVIRASQLLGSEPVDASALVFFWNQVPFKWHELPLPRLEPVAATAYDAARIGFLRSRFHYVFYPQHVGGTHIGLSIHENSVTPVCRFFLLSVRNIHCPQRAICSLPLPKTSSPTASSFLRAVTQVGHFQRIQWSAFA